MSDDFKGVVVDLLCSEQVGIVGTNCLRQWHFIVLLLSCWWSWIEYTLYIFSAFQGFCSKAFHPYLREPSRRSSEIDEETLVCCPPTWNLFHHPDILLRKHWIQWDCFYWVNRIAQWPLNASLECETRPSAMEVSPKTFGLSKSLHVDGEQTNSISQVFTML